jgi:CHAD domain-containing protein
MKARLQFADPITSSREEIQRQFHLIRGLERATAAGNVEALHDLRVALRRLRVLLRALAEPLAYTRAAALERRWQHFADELSPLRDADVWRGMLRELPGVTPSFRCRVTARLRQERIHPAEVLLGAIWPRLKCDTRQLLTRSLPAALTKAGRLAVEEGLRSAWGQACARTAKLARNSHLAALEAAHKLRIACRRARYLAEFFATAVEGKKNALAWQRVGEDYRALQNALGRTHDADVLLEFLHAAHLRPPTAVTRELHKRRAAGVRQFKKTWRKMAEQGKGHARGIAASREHTLVPVRHA